MQSYLGSTNHNAGETMSKLKSNTIDFFRELKTSYERQSEDCYKSFVRRWSEVDCFFEHVVRALGSRFAHDFMYKEKEIQNRETRRAIADIVKATCLDSLIDYDEKTGKMPWRQSVSSEMKTEIAEFMIDSSASIMPSFDNRGIAEEMKD